MNGTLFLKNRLPPNVHEYRDRHGKLRRYFRKRGHPQIALKGKPRSIEFITAYNAALASLTLPEIGKQRSAPGSLSAAIANYYTHNRFRALAPTTQKMRRAILERLRAEHGEKRLALIQKVHIAKILGSKKPFAARNWLKTLRGLMEFAVEVGLRRDDPSSGIEPAKTREGRIHTWTEEEIAQFEAHHPVGSRSRLAMALLLYTGQRRSDVVKMGPQHIRSGVLRFTQQKTRTPLTIPVYPKLAELIAATPCGHLTFLVAAGGKPFSAAGFGNLFREWCNEAGLPQCSAHGLRKAACRRLAEVGCSAPEIAAISGHKSLKEVQRYIEEADQARLARAAMRRMTGQSENGDVANLGDGSGYPIDSSKT
jgi:integrase